MMRLQPLPNLPIDKTNHNFIRIPMMDGRNLVWALVFAVALRTRAERDGREDEEDLEVWARDYRSEFEEAATRRYEEDYQEGRDLRVTAYDLN